MCPPLGLLALRHISPSKAIPAHLLSGLNIVYHPSVRNLLSLFFLVTLALPLPLRAQESSLDPLNKCPFSLTPGSRYEVGSSPFALTVGDIDADTFLDAVIVNAYSNNLSIFLGKGNGEFKERMGIKVGSRPLAVGLADFNGDGHLDIATTNLITHSISIILGKEGDAFEPEFPLPIPGSPFALLVRDLDGDTRVDIVVSDIDGDRIIVMRGKGDGTFGALTPYPVGALPSAIAASDVNGDGLDDLISVNFSSSNFSILLNKGGLIFESAKRFEVSNKPRLLSPEHKIVMRPFPLDLLVTDFNGDALPDVTTANYGMHDISMLFQQEDGSLAQPVNLPVGQFPSSILAEDMNGDAIVDLVVANAGSDRISVLIGKGDGTFDDSAAQYAVDFIPSAVATGDFNNDNRVDLGVISFQESTFQVFLNASKGGENCFRASLYALEGGSMSGPPLLPLEPSHCGNGLLDSNEECDDGNTTDGDGCSQDCLLEIGVCGDGIVQKLLGEQCEGSTFDLSLPYGCSDVCRFLSPTCGNGSLDPGEECDAAEENSSEPDARCRKDCSLSRCGDGVLDATELCDDGNLLPGDGCDRLCVLEPPSFGSGENERAIGSALEEELPPALEENASSPSGEEDAGPSVPLPAYGPLYAPTHPPAGDTGPATLAIMAAGAAAGFAWTRRKKGGVPPTS